MVVFKYELQKTGIQVLELPSGAQLLTVLSQNGILCLWALVNVAMPLEKRTIKMVGTGHEHSYFGKHINTVQDGPFVWHFFED